MYGGLLNNNTRLKAECLCLTNHSERRSWLKLFTITLFITNGKTKKKNTRASHLVTMKSAEAEENQNFLWIWAQLRVYSADQVTFPFAQELF